MFSSYKYKDFEPIIIEVFSSLIKSFELEVISKSNDKFDELEFSNGKCIIRFVYDMGSVGSVFINPIEKSNAMPRLDALPPDFPVYHIYSVHEFLYPNDKNKYGSGEWDFNKQIYWAEKLISERFVNVLNGDFSWTHAYKQKDYRLSQKIEYMAKYFDFENPIQKKFYNGDISWEKDFDEYKKLLDNLQSSPTK